MQPMVNILPEDNNLNGKYISSECQINNTGHSSLLENTTTIPYLNAIIADYKKGLAVFIWFEI